MFFNADKGLHLTIDRLWVAALAASQISAVFAQPVEFRSVDQVLSELRADPEIEFREQGSWLIAEGRFTTWTFTAEDHPAHPAVVERRVYEEDGSIKIGTRTICTAEKNICSSLFRELAGGTAQDTAASTSGTDDRSVLQQPGLTISLSDPGNWTLTRRSAAMVVLGQDGTSPGDSVVAATQLERLPTLVSDDAFLEFVVTQRSESLGNDPRVASPEFDEQLVQWKGQACVRTRYRYEDTGAIQQDGSVTRMKFANNGLRCRHPDDSTIGVRISYSARYGQDLDMKSFESDARAFIDSVLLTPFDAAR